MKTIPTVSAKPAKLVGSQKVPILIAVMALLAGLKTSAVQGATIVVPSTQPTIALAIAAAQPGDTILINNGTYSEHDLFITKSITISGAGGATNCIIDNQQLGRGLIISNITSSPVTIIGLTIKNSAIPYYSAGGEILVVTGPASIHKCIFEGASGAADYSGWSVGNLNSDTTLVSLYDCVIQNNFAANLAGVGNCILVNSLIINNTGGNNCDAVNNCYATNCTVYGNGGGYLGNVWTVGGGSGGIWWKCIVENNLPAYANQQIYNPTLVEYCFVQGGFAGTGNTNADPLLINPSGGNFGLQANSPASNLSAVPPNGYPYIGGQPDLSLEATLPGPSQATATAEVVNGFVVGATITSGGSGYTNNPTVTITGGNGSGATATATETNGVVTAITILNPGSGYTGNPSIFIAAPPIPPEQATATGYVTNGFLTSIVINDGGHGYTNPPAVFVFDGGGTNGAAVATISNGVVTAINITNPGGGYTNAPFILVASPPGITYLQIKVSQVEVDMSVIPGYFFQLQNSSDLTTWSNINPPFLATNNVVTQFFNVKTNGTYFRLVQQP